MGPVTFEEHKKMLQEMVQKDFKELLKGKGSSSKYQAMYEGARVMVDVEKILPLFEGSCGKKSCDEKNEVVEQKLEAGVLTVTYQCKNGHRDVWHSSKVLSTKGGQKLFVSSTLLAAATLITGNNFEKISLFALFEHEFYLINNFSSHSDILCHSKHQGTMG